MKFRILVLLGLSIALMSCTKKTYISESHGEALIRIWENGNIQDLGKIMAHDAVYEAAQQGHSYNGIDEIGNYVGHVNSFAKDLKIKIISLKSSETSAVVEWIMSGIQNRPIEGRVSVATNREFNVKGVTIIEINDGLISKATDYMDVLGFVIQLGARVELPGGMVLELK